MTVAVAINVYKETPVQLTECFSRVRANLSSKVKIFLDGQDRPEVVALAKVFGFEVVVSPNCGCNDRWHLWWLRMLEFFVQSGADVCFKIDPDTMVDRSPVLCSADYFGSVESFNGYDYVQGGITGMSQRAASLAKTVLEQGTFKSVEECVCSGGRPTVGYFAGPVSSWAFTDDHAIAHVLKQVGILPVAWVECLSVWRKPIGNLKLRYAMVHPRYYIEA